MSGRAPRRRALTVAEAKLWHAVARTATPLPHARLPDLPPEPPPPPEAPAAPDARPAPAEPPRPASKAARPGPELALDHGPGSAHRRLSALDGRTADRLRRGELAPQAAIDLHGLRQDQAHAALIHFLTTAWTRGIRLALVITGRGSPRGQAPRSTLREKVPLWLAESSLSPRIVAVSAAHQRHGGAGAFYVYLRRHRGA